MKKDDDKEISISEALTALRTGGKLWRAWAKAEAVADLLAQADSRLVSLQNSISKASAEMEAANVKLASVNAEIAKATEHAVSVVASAKQEAAIITAKANATRASAEDKVAAAVSEVAKLKDSLAERHREVHAAELELDAVNTNIANAKAQARKLIDG